ncbi:HAD-IIB family hydrolase, partial [Candidatus Falkowbacteria bacterium]|nr:HAD-IIB family hydrolase [Candidatus Falkowbacteria bacterium]
ALPMFKKFLRKNDVILVYITGRNIGLIKQAIKEYDLPEPDYAIADVGTTIFCRQNRNYIEHKDWGQKILKDWDGYDWDSLNQVLEGIDDFRLQEKKHQKKAKLSYYTDKDSDRNKIIKAVQNELRCRNVKATVIFSIDETAAVGLLDILPRSAGKKRALDHLIKFLKFDKDNVVCAGDSGNDLDLMLSGYKAVLVKNARKEVKAEVKKGAKKKGLRKKIYFAKGGFKGLNGNYLSGVLEGLDHFKLY